MPHFKVTAELGQDAIESFGEINATLERLAGE
jgi:hypothetical protein